MNAPLPLATMQQQGGALAAQPQQNYAPGFGSSQSFELMIRQSKLLMSTTLVPAAYRAEIVKLDKYGAIKDIKENPNALSNCAVALNMATRMGADPLMVMQNLYIVEGRPSWSSQWIIAAINGCGRFSPLRFEIKALGKKTIPYTTTYWENNERRTKTENVQIEDKSCIAWVKELATGERLESPPITIEMAVREGWYSKNGSKWQTMEEVMLRYRSASFFGKLYAPELLMGLQSTEEVHDFIDMEVSGPTPAWQATEMARSVESLRTGAATTHVGQDEVVDHESGEITQGAAAPTSAPAPSPAAQADTGKSAFDPVAFGEKLEACTDVDALDVMADEIRSLADKGTAELLTDVYKARRATLTAGQAQGTATAQAGASRRGRSTPRAAANTGSGDPRPDPLE